MFEGDKARIEHRYIQQSTIIHIYKYNVGYARIQQKESYVCHITSRLVSNRLINIDLTIAVYNKPYAGRSSDLKENSYLFNWKESKL